MRLQALTAGVETPAECFSGVVHSVFRHACNVSHERGALLTLVSWDKGNLPQGFRLNTPSGFSFLNLARVGQPVFCRGGILRIHGSDLSVDLRTASRWHVDLKDLRLDLHSPDRTRAWSVAWRELVTHGDERGVSSSFMATYPAGPTSHHRWCEKGLYERATPLVSALVRATSRLDLEDAVAATHSMIGLGSGLTPSGDDFLVGYLAGLWSTTGDHPARRHFMAGLGAGLFRAGGNTNVISRTYLNFAIQGYTSEPITMLAQQLKLAGDDATIQRATRVALQVGHTSGADGVFGLLLGCLAWTASPLLALIGAHMPHVPQCGFRERRNDAARTLFLTWYTILCSSCRPGNWRAVPLAHSCRDLRGGWVGVRRSTLLQDLLFAD